MKKKRSVIRRICKFFENLVDPYCSDVLISSNNFFQFLWNCAYGFKKYIACIVFLSALSGILESLIFFFLCQTIDHAALLAPAYNNVWGETKNYLLIFFSLIVISPITTILLTLFKFQTIQGNLPMTLRWKFHIAFLKKDTSFFDNEFSGDLSTKVMQTALAVRHVIISLCDTSVFVCVYFISAAMVLTKFDTILLIPFCLWLVAYLGTCIYFIPRLTKVAQNQANERSFVTGIISDIYSNITSVKLFSHSKKELEYTKKSMEQMMIPVHEQQRLVSYFDSIIHTLSIIMTFIIFIITFYSMTIGKVSAGVVVASSAIALRFSSISQWAMWVIADLFEHVGTVQNGAQIIRYQSKVRDVSDIDSSSKDFKISEGLITFNNISFYYDKKNKKILNNFNMTIAPGEKVGLVGSSGAGKSTIVKLLVRLYDPQDGSVTIDGQDIRLVEQDILRSQISLVSQDILLFHRSIKDNLLIANPYATDEEIIEASKQAGAHEFITGLQDCYGNSGYDANVGERGIKLSGGQRQRIAIARVILKNAPILILDEATSALDSNSEKIIQENFKQITKGKTVLSIAHRLSTLNIMDRILVIDNGMIVEEGNHSTLLQKHDGIYSLLWHRQSEGFISMNKDLKIDTKIVRTIIDLQFPEYKKCTIKQIKNQEVENKTFRLGEELLIKIPGTFKRSDQILNEFQLINILKDQIQIRIPEPIKLGHPCETIPWQWAIYKWIDGKDAFNSDNKDMQGIAYDLAHTLNKLHSIKLEVPITNKHNIYGKENLKDCEDEVLVALNNLQNFVNTNVVKEIWDLAINSCWEFEPVILHGDVSSKNLLLDSKGRLYALIGFGLITKGDPAYDLTISWTFFKGISRQIFMQNITQNSKVWNRAKGWVLWKSLIIANDKSKTSQEHKKSYEIIEDIVKEFLENKK
ncbi:MAG: ATP-binding cassette domain-containing protein [Rickettsiaceae bacterium]